MQLFLCENQLEVNNLTDFAAMRRPRMFNLHASGGQAVGGYFMHGRLSQTKLVCASKPPIICNDAGRTNIKIENGRLIEKYRNE